MSTTGGSPLPRALFTGLIDDAAVFPPGNASIADALTAHAHHRRQWYAAFVGPLLLPAAELAEAAEVMALREVRPPESSALREGRPPESSALREVRPPESSALREGHPSEATEATVLREGRPSHAAEHLEIVVVARPGVAMEVVRAATDLAQATAGIVLRATEIGWQPRWREAALDTPVLVLELPRGEVATVVADIATGAAGQRAIGKFRTGATPTWPWPDAAELAHVLGTAARADLPLKLTGGLHHLVRGTYADQENHGLLNVLLAAHLAQNAAPLAQLIDVLEERDSVTLSDHLAALRPAQVRRTRGLIPAYGCCTVTDPIAELTASHLLEGPLP